MSAINQLIQKRNMVSVKQQQNAFKDWNLPIGRIGFNIPYHTLILEITSQESLPHRLFRQYPLWMNLALWIWAFYKLNYMYDRVSSSSLLRSNSKPAKDSKLLVV